jgi:GH15 family glucan-1,4-alpha-glucosidase
VIAAGERRYLSLAYAEDGPAVVPTHGEMARTKIERSVRWWQGWAARCRYDGPYRDAVVRSALALKLLTYAPSGAIVAAPTTSLPETLGGWRNWDYRYCWLRDASLTLRALFELGYHEEAAAFLEWQLHITRLTHPRLQVLYDVFGRSRLPELELTHLEGYAGSRPVRIGNGAHAQFQLDVYGEMVEAVAEWVKRGGAVSRDSRRFLASIGRLVCRAWREPDHGIWESRGPLQHYTYSKVLAWVALDRLLTLHEGHGVDLPAAKLRGERDALRDAIERRGYNERLGCYTETFEGDTVDASLLALPLYGYIDAADPRMRGTFARVIERLGSGALVHRNAPREQEGAFGICSFWAVEVQALAGDLAGATARFERLLGYANDLGLYAEEIDPDDGAALGNFPQGFTHIGLINAALVLQRCAMEAGRV